MAVRTDGSEVCELFLYRQTHCSKSWHCVCVVYKEIKFSVFKQNASTLKTAWV